MHSHSFGFSREIKTVFLSNQYFEGVFNLFFIRYVYSAGALDLESEMKTGLKMGT